MADRIEQQLGIDARSALQALDQFDKSVQSVNNSVAALTGTMDKFNATGKVSLGLMRNISRSSARLATNLNAIGNVNLQSLPQSLQGAANAANTASNNLRSMTSNLQQAERQTTRLTVSFETMARIVTTQLIVRAISQIRDAFRESVSQAIELQRRVALITTIAGGIGQEQITGDVVNLSTQFNIPLLEAAEGLYNAISNQVGNYTQSLEFSTEAAKFAQATNSSLADSVDLLSGALRAFDLDVSQTGRVAGIFFSAIDKGRVTADELANTMGRVLEPASALGIELEEITAGVAAISERGLGASQSLTQFRGVITALQKPTVAMRAALQDLGFTSSEQAIATLGMAGALEELGKTAGDSSEALARLFPNIRGFGGQLGLTQENLGTFIRDIEAARAAGSEFANEKFFEATATDAAKLTKAINAAKNTLVTEFGQAVVSTGAELADLLGGVEGITKGIRIMVPALETLALNLVLVGTGFAALKLVALASINPITAAVLLTAGATAALSGALKAAEEQAIQTAEAPIRELEKINKGRIETFKKFEEERLNAQKIADEAILQSGLQRLRKLNAAEITFTRESVARDKNLVASVDATLDQVVGRREQLLKTIESAITGIDSEVAASLQRVTSLQRGQNTREFEFGIRGTSDTSQAESLLSRAFELAEQAKSELFTAFETGDKVARQNALALFQEAEAAAQQADGIAERTNNRDLEVQAFAQLQDLAQSQIDAERQINELQDERRAKLEQERAQQAAIVQELKNQAKIVLDNTGLFNTEGRRFSEQQQASRSSIRQNALRRIGDLQLQSDDFDIGSTLGITQQLDALQREVQANPINLQFSVEGQIQGLSAELEQGFATLLQQFPLAEQLSEALDRPIRSINEAIDGVAELQTLLQQLQQQQSSNTQSELALQLKKDTVLKALDESAVRLARTETVGSEKAQQQQLRYIESLQATNDELTRLVENNELSVQKLNALFQQQITPIFKEGFDVAGSGAQLEANLLTKIFGQGRALDLAQLQEQFNAVVDVSPAVDNLEQLRDALGQYGEETKVIPEALNSSLTPASQLRSTMSDAADDAERFANALNSVGSSAFSQFQAFGTARMMHFATGGANRGTDTIPAMLSNKESVINARASSRFFSQIQAMNAGQNPVYRSTGGNVTNVGDINVSVNNTTSSPVNGRSLVNDLRREIRKGNKF